MVRIFILVATLVASVSVFAKSSKNHDPLRQAMKINESALKFQSERLKVIAENMANQSSTGSKPGEEAYRRKIIVGENKHDKNSGANLLKKKKITKDKSPQKKRYEPHHPAADEQGYVYQPNVSSHIENADSMEAEHSYNASLSAIETTKNMMNKTMEIMRQ